MLSQFAVSKISTRGRRLWFALDALISIVCLVGVALVGYLSFREPNFINILASLGSLIGFIYSTWALYRQAVIDNIDREEFLAASEVLFRACTEVSQRLKTLSESDIISIRDRVINALLNEWKKTQAISLLEYDAIEMYSAYFTEATSLTFSDRILLKYQIVTGFFNEYFPRLSTELQNADFSTTGTPYNDFIRKLFLYHNGEDISTFSTAEIGDHELQEFASLAFRKSLKAINDLLSETKKKERVKFLLSKAYENAYAAIGGIRGSHERPEKPLYLMFKYDERFSIPERQWRHAIRLRFEKTHGKGEVAEKKISAANDKLAKIFSPLPFARAIRDFNECIYQVGRDYFLFVIDPEAFDLKYRNWQPQVFIEKRVVPRAKQHLKQMNSEFIRKFPYLKSLRKQSLSANYYIFQVEREMIGLYADFESIPGAIRGYILNNILESDKGAEHVASQLIYIKQVINNLSLSGLLFTEDISLQEKIRKVEKGLVSKAKKANLMIGKIDEIASLGNQSEKLIYILHEALYKKKPKSKKTKEYKFCKQVVDRIVENAGELGRIFAELKS